MFATAHPTRAMRLERRIGVETKGEYSWFRSDNVIYDYPAVGLDVNNMALQTVQAKVRIIRLQQVGGDEIEVCARLETLDVWLTFLAAQFNIFKPFAAFSGLPTPIDQNRIAIGRVLVAVAAISKEPVALREKLERTG